MRTLAGGCYVEPTVVRAQPEDRVCQEEVFGPFVTVTTFKDDDEVLADRQRHEYGLGGGLWTQQSAARPSRARGRWTAAWSGSTATSASTRARRSAACAVRLRARDGFRGDARIHQTQVRVGERRREAAAVLSALGDGDKLMLPCARRSAPS